MKKRLMWTDDFRDQEIIRSLGAHPTLDDLANVFGLSVPYLCQIIARTRLAPHRENRVLCRPLDMGGPRGVWIDYDLVD